MGPIRNWQKRNAGILRCAQNDNQRRNKESVVDLGFEIPEKKSLDLLSLGALVHRLDPGIIPFRKATNFAIHVSGGEFNVAANLSDCFGQKTGIASAIVSYPIGDLIAERVRGMGVKPFFKRFRSEEH